MVIATVTLDIARQWRSQGYILGGDPIDDRGLDALSVIGSRSVDSFLQLSRK